MGGIHDVPTVSRVRLSSDGAGIMPFMVQELDKSVGGSLNATLANNLHEGKQEAFFP